MKPRKDRPFDQTYIALGRAEETFRGVFGGEPVWAASAPGRVNLIGEHTDYSGGFVLPMAIDRVCVALAAPAKRGNKGRVFSADVNQGGEIDLRDLTPQRFVPGTWVSYVAGVMAEITDLPGPAVDLAIASTVPLGSGLSSSASVEVAVATVMAEAWELELPAAEKARACRRAEHRFAGVPCGIMDQMISAMGHKNHALLIDCEREEATRVKMPPASACVVLVMNSGVRHALAGGEYAKRKDACMAAAKALGVPSLRHASMERVEAARGTLSPEELRAARHVVSENARTQEAAAALMAGNLTRVGELMAGSHASLRDDFRVSCEELDTLVAAGYADRHGVECELFVTPACDGAKRVQL